MENTSHATRPLLEVDNLKTHFPVRRGILQRVVDQVRAVDGVSFKIQPGETLGLVGESGCGKTTVGRTILRLIPATAGAVRYDGENVFDMNAAEMRDIRRKMQIIFQDPYASLNPRLTIEESIAFGPKVHGMADAA